MTGSWQAPRRPILALMRFLRSAPSLAAGALLACVGAPPRPTPAPGLPARGTSLGGRERALLAATVDTLVARGRDSAVVCLAILSDSAGPYAPGPDLLATLALRQRVVPRSACPRTYSAGMMVVTDSLGRPLRSPARGYVPPRRLVVSRPVFEAPDRAYVYAREERGAMGQDAVCVAQYVDGRASASCDLRSVWDY